MKHDKRDLMMSLLIIGFAITILLGSLFAIRNLAPRQDIATGRFIFDNGCYGIYNAGKLSCISSHIGKQCNNGCYVASTIAGNKCECLPD